MRTMSAPSAVTALKSSPNALLAGSADGVLRLYDFRTGSRSDNDASELSVLAHVGGVISVDASGTAALTIGWNLRFRHETLRNHSFILLIRRNQAVKASSGPFSQTL